MPNFLPPSSCLPPIQSIATTSVENLSNSVRFLYLIYNPGVRGSSRRTNDSRRTVAADVDELSQLRNDTFERKYAMKWLTALVSRLGCGLVPDGEETEELLQSAASLLAICSGTASAGVIARDFVFKSLDGLSPEVRVQLKDNPLDNADYRSVGAQTWGGACVMAEMIVDEPGHFGLVLADLRKRKLLRVLELGAGTGLVSLAFAKLAHSLATEADATVTIVATDYYPSVLANLEGNIRANYSNNAEIDNLRLSAHTLDWSSFPNLETHESPFDEPFDVIFGADIIYEAEHARWIKSCLEKLLRKPSSQLSPSQFHLIIPLRRTHTSESNTVEIVFRHKDGYKPEGCGLELVIKHKETFICDTGDGQDDHRGVEYAYYQIEWW